MENGTSVYFRYSTAWTGPGTPTSILTRDEAISRLRARAGNVVVIRYPGAVPVEVRVGQGLRGDPEVQADGWGWLPPSRVTRISQALAEAAAVAEEAAQ